MSPNVPKATKQPQETLQPARTWTGNSMMPYDVIRQSELLWWPYRSLAKALLHTHHDTGAFVEINRRLADELREIGRREQNFVLELTEKLLTKMSDGENARKTSARVGMESIEEFYDSAIAGVREFGNALADAQVRSMEALREQARRTNAVVKSSVDAGKDIAAE